LVATTREQHHLAHGCAGEDACKRIGLNLDYGPLPNGEDGLITGKRIVVNQAVTWTPRVQFTIFHEVMHYLLDDDGEIIEYFTRTLRTDEEKYKSAIERCCNIGAAEFLMPREYVRRAVNEKRFSVDLVEYVAGQFHSSLVAAALQVASCAPIDCYIVLCAYGPIPRSPQARSGLYVEYAGAPTRSKYPLARFTPIPDDHLLFHTWTERVPASGPAYVPFRSGKRPPCDCETRLVGDRVIGLLALETMAPPEQLALRFDDTLRF